MALTNTLPIVGAFYRPPAKVVLQSLAVGTPMFLMAEPENQYDPNAIAVWMNTSDIPQASQDELEGALPQFGFTLAQVLEMEQIHLGYIPKEMAAKIVASGKLGSAPYDVTYSTSPSGSPRVRSVDPLDA